MGSPFCVGADIIRPKTLFVGDGVLDVPLRFKSCETNGRSESAPTQQKNACTKQAFFQSSINVLLYSATLALSPWQSTSISSRFIRRSIRKNISA